MSRLVLVTDPDAADQLLMLVPDNYLEAQVREPAEKGGLKELDVQEVKLPDHLTGVLHDMGVKEWREYWG